MSKYTEINVAKPLKFEHRMKLNDLVRIRKQNFLNSSDYIEIFPGHKVRFWLHFVDGIDAFLVGVRGKVLNKSPGFGAAGKVEVEMNGTSKTEYFGNAEKNEFVEFETMESFKFKSAVIPFTINGDEKINVEMKWTLFKQQPLSVFQGDNIPESLLSQESLSVTGKAMMADVSTADLIIKCGDEIFKVHKVFLCNR